MVATSDTHIGDVANRHLFACNINFAQNAPRSASTVGTRATTALLRAHGMQHEFVAGFAALTLRAVSVAGADYEEMLVKQGCLIDWCPWLPPLPNTSNQGQSRTKRLAFKALTEFYTHRTHEQGIFGDLYCFSLRTYRIFINCASIIVQTIRSPSLKPSARIEEFSARFTGRIRIWRRAVSRSRKCGATSSVAARLKIVRSDGLFSPGSSWPI